MSLLQNISRLNAEPLTYIGGTRELRTSQLARSINRFTAMDHQYGVPVGNLPPTAWFMPIKEGGMASISGIKGLGALTLSLAGGRGIGVTMAGTGELTPLISAIANIASSNIAGSGGFLTNPVILGGINAVCNIYGVGLITNALLGDGITREDIAALLAGTSTMSGNISSGKGISSDLSGSGGLAASIQAIANMVIEINSIGSLSAAISAPANISADITPFTVLSPQNLAAEVWNTIAADFNRTGTFGNKLNLASSGGIDYDTLVTKVWAALLASHDDPNSMGATMAKLIDIAKLTGNKVTKTGNILTIYEDDGLTIWKTVDITNGGRVLS